MLYEPITYYYLHVEVLCTLLYVCVCVWTYDKILDSCKVSLTRFLWKLDHSCPWLMSSLMDGLYRIFTEVIGNQLQKGLPCITHLQWDILRNILNVPEVMYYFEEYTQEIVLMGLYFENHMIMYIDCLLPNLCLMMVFVQGHQALFFPWGLIEHCMLWWMVEWQNKVDTFDSSNATRLFVEAISV